MSLRVILLESPLQLLVVLVFLDFILLHIWTRRRTRLTARLAWAGLIAVPVALTLQYLVVTDQERLRNSCRRLARATGQADVAGFARFIADDFVAERRGRRADKSELLRQFEELLTRWDVQEERLSDFTYEVAADQANVEFQASCRLVSNDILVPYHVSRWRLTFRRDGDAWRVTHIEPLTSRRGLGGASDWLGGA